MPKHKKNGRYMARRRRSGEDYHLGTFDTYDEARAAEIEFDKEWPPCPPGQYDRVLTRNRHSR